MRLVIILMIFFMNVVSIRSQVVKVEVDILLVLNTLHVLNGLDFLFMPCGSSAALLDLFLVFPFFYFIFILLVLFVILSLCLLIVTLSVFFISW